MINIEEITISRFHEMLELGEITCERLVSAYLERIEQFDRRGPRINSIITVNPNALNEARELDVCYKSGKKRAPLYGVPVLLKDNCETRDIATTAGSVCLDGWITGRDAEIVTLLKDAGAIILAKTNLHEFALWGETFSTLQGQTLNPYDLSRTPGGSSGGTGAALAANFGLVGIGTDTVNSIRSPASANALCGIRPTTGLVSADGIVPYSNSQDTAGPMARTVEDAVRVLDVIVKKEHRPTHFTDHLRSDGLTGKRLGCLKSFWGTGESSYPVNGVIDSAMEALKEAGAELVALDDNIDSAWLAQEVSVHMYELKVHLGEYLASFKGKAPVSSVGEMLTSGKCAQSVADLLSKANALNIDSPDYVDRLQKVEAVRLKLLDIMTLNNLDAIIYPHQQQLVCKIGESQGQRNGVLASVIGWPSIAVPAGFSAPDEHAAIGVPIGLEIIGRPHDEAVLIEIAYGFERAGAFRRSPRL